MTDVQDELTAWELHQLDCTTCGEFIFEHKHGRCPDAVTAELLFAEYERTLRGRLHRVSAEWHTLVVRVGQALRLIP